MIANYLSWNAAKHNSPPNTWIVHFYSVSQELIGSTISGRMEVPLNVACRHTNTFRFFLWGCLKQNVYATHPYTMKLLRQRIVEKCRIISGGGVLL